MSYIYHIIALLSSIIIQTNKNVVLVPKEARLSHYTGTGTLNGSHDAFDVLMYVSFSYLSKVNLGGKVVHWTRILSQDFCSLMHHFHLFPLLLSCPYL